MRRGEIRWADIGGPHGRRPVLIVAATELIAHVNAVTCAPITTTVRGIATRVLLGRPEGLARRSEAACEALVTIPKSDMDTAPLGSLSEARFAELDRAIARALDVRAGHLPRR